MTPPTSPVPSPSPVRSRRRIILIAVTVTVMVSLGAAVQIGGYYYRRFGPVEVCQTVPVKSERTVTAFRLSDPDAPAWLGSQAKLACPEAKQSFTEWYAFRVHLADNFIDAVFEARESDHAWGIVGFGLWATHPLRPLSPHFGFGKEVHWPDRGMDASMLTRSHTGRWETSLMRLVSEGPHARAIEVQLYAPDAELHFFVTPLTPGYRGSQVGDERTRPGSWFQYLSLFALGRAEGELTLYDAKGAATTYPLIGPGGGPALVYMEHMWGQSDRPRRGLPCRYYWDWGDWAKPETGEAILCAQVDAIEQGVHSSAGLFFGMGPAFTFSYDPPREATRMVYRRLEPIEGMLYPQQFHLLARSSESPAFINMQGFVRSSYHDWQAYDLSGRAGDGTSSLDWTTEPVWSVTDFYKGAQARETLPGPAEKLRVQREPDGCRIFWTPGDPGADRLEFWVFRLSSGQRLDPGIPIGIVLGTAPVPSGATAGPDAEPTPEPGRAAPQPDELEWFDPAGTDRSIYKVVSVSVPDTLFHRRLMAGPARCSKGAEVQPPPLAAPAALAAALDPDQAAAFTGAISRDRQLPDSNPAARVRLVKDSASGALEFHLETKDAEQWGAAQTLRPRFSPRTQVQSFSPLALGPNRIAVAWSERSPIMDGDRYHDWEVYVSVMDLSDGSFRVIEVSMSDFESVEVSLEQHEDALTVLWQECAEGFCIPAQETVGLSQP